MGKRSEQAIHRRIYTVANKHMKIIISYTMYLLGWPKASKQTKPHTHIPRTTSISSVVANANQLEL